MRSLPNKTAFRIALRSLMFGEEFAREVFQC